jgi:hypothetical protein
MKLSGNTCKSNNIQCSLSTTTDICQVKQESIFYLNGKMIRPDTEAEYYFRKFGNKSINLCN